MSETRIRWEPDGHNGFEGYAGTSERLFDVWYAWSDFGGVSIGEWALSSQLPQPRSRRQPHGRDPEALKAEAERWLSEFISSLGAVFPESATLPDRDKHHHLDLTCGACGEEFGTNCDDDDIRCAVCSAHRCPHCGGWFGSDD